MNTETKTGETNKAEKKALGAIRRLLDRFGGFGPGEWLFDGEPISDKTLQAAWTSLGEQVERTEDAEARAEQAEKELESQAYSRYAHAHCDRVIAGVRKEFADFVEHVAAKRSAVPTATVSELREAADHYERSGGVYGAGHDFLRRVRAALAELPPTPGERE